MKKYPYVPNHHVLEIHIGTDVFHRDYGIDESPVNRAITRLIASPMFLTIDRIRHWHSGSMLSVYEPDMAKIPDKLIDYANYVKTEMDKHGIDKHDIEDVRKIWAIPPSQSDTAILERDVIPCAREIAAAATSRGHGDTCNCAACRNDRADIFFKYQQRYKSAEFPVNFDWLA